MEIQEETEVKDNYGRFKDADWFKNIYKRDILVIGNGGIGGWLSLFLARTGATLHTFDMDTFGSENLAGQLVRYSDIGKNKTEGVKDIIKELCDPDVEVNTYSEEYTKDSMTNNIVLMGVDNMKARKTGFENWVKFLQEFPEEKENSLFIDGRLSMTKLQIYCIKGNDENSIQEYRNNHLFDDSEVEDLECTMKQTSHIAAMIASTMTGFVTNFLSDANRQFGVPFFYSYFIPLNFTETN